GGGGGRGGGGVGGGGGGGGGGRGKAERAPADHRRDARRPVRAGRRRSARHVHHAIRLGDEREPLDDDHGAGGAGRGTRRARTGSGPRRHTAGGRAVRADDSGRRHHPRRSHDDRGRA